MNNVKKICCLSFLLLALACKEKYVPNINAPVTGYLVVEGFINSGPGPTTITLSRTVKISQISNNVYETKASVRVEGQINTIGFALTETANGVYTNPQLTLNANDQYRVHIKTKDGKEYVSDYSAIRSTPDIDSVYWRRENGGVQIYADTHDPNNQTKYYQYKYDETWEFHSTYTTSLKIVRNAMNKIAAVGYLDSATFGPNLSIYTCWQTATIIDVLIASSEKLTKDVIALQPISYIEPGSWKLGVLYSINVKQYAVSQRGYRFLEALKKNTEQLGTVFDAQPSDNNGNIHCISDASEPAIGFVEVSEEKQKRIFIRNLQVPDWTYNQHCADEQVILNLPENLTAATGMGLLPTNPFKTSGNAIVLVNFASQECIDCTLRGTNTKPSFWP